MSKLTIALLGTQSWVRPKLESLLAGDNVEFLAGDSHQHANLCLLGTVSGDPSRALRQASELRLERPRLPIILLAFESSEKLAISALKQGVLDYFAPPVDLAEVAARVRRLRDTCPAQLSEGARPIVGDSPAMVRLNNYLHLVAQRDCNALVVGETGTGKELIAEAIHANSPRRNKPFVCINCAAVPDTLLESELFGYERGAFTGATTSTEGKIRQAHGGTILFDEIGEMTLYAQAKILRFIESKQVQRLGSKGTVPVDVRIIAATNQDLPVLIAEQRFRKDLYFRLNVARIEVPPLRERKSDIAPILAHYVRIYNRQTGSYVEDFTPDAMLRLQEYDWPGNVRELKNVIEAIFIDPPDRLIETRHLPLAACSTGPRSGSSEREQLVDALEATHWNKSKAAEKLRWSRMRIYRKIAKYKIRDQPMDPDSEVLPERALVAG